MEQEPIQDEITAHETAPGKNASVAMHDRALGWTERVWRLGGTVVAIGLALLLGWHVVNGQHGLSAWEQKRQEDKQLQKEIDDLQKENDRLRVRVEKLKSDPDAIEHEAREKLHYAKPGEVIYALPQDPKQQTDSQTK